MKAPTPAAQRRLAQAVRTPAGSLEHGHHEPGATCQGGSRGLIGSQETQLAGRDGYPHEILQLHLHTCIGTARECLCRILAAPACRTNWPNSDTST